MNRKWMFLYFAALASGVAAPAAGSDSEKLYAAIRAGDLGGLKALLDGGVSPNARDSREITPSDVRRRDRLGGRDADSDRT